MKYFLTGATGFVGGRLARQLRANGDDVVALVRDVRRATDLAAIGVTLAAGDITDKASMRAPMTGVDGVFHVAAWYKVGTRDSSQAEAINVGGTRHVLELMEELRIPKGVYTSTLAVNSDTHGQIVDETYRFTGTHLSEYDRTKAAAHDVARGFIARGLPLVIVQPGMIYGPGDAGPSHDLLASFLARKLPMLPARTALCWAHVDDIVRGHVAAMAVGRTGENYDLCGPVHTIVEAMHLAETITGVRAPRMIAPPWMLKAMSALMTVVERVVPVPANYSSEYLRVSAGVTYIARNAKARREFQWNPRPLRDGLVETFRSMGAPTR